jgi:hypothetical protein
MQTQRFSQFFSFGLAALMTLGVLAGIDHQAQPLTQTVDPLLAQVAAPKA